MKRTLVLLMATAIAVLALGATQCPAQTQSSAVVVLPTVPRATVAFRACLKNTMERRAILLRGAFEGQRARGLQRPEGIPLLRVAGLRGTSSDPLPPPGVLDPVKAWIGEHHHLLGQLAIAQVLVLMSVSGIVLWVTHRRRT